MNSLVHGKTSETAVIRTRTRPAIESVSGEEGPRPKCYFLVFTFLEYAFTDAKEYENAPGPPLWGRGDMAMATLRRAEARLVSRTSDASFWCSLSVSLVCNTVPTRCL